MVKSFFRTNPVSQAEEFGGLLQLPCKTPQPESGAGPRPAAASQAASATTNAYVNSFGAFDHPPSKPHNCRADVLVRGVTSGRASPAGMHFLSLTTVNAPTWNPAAWRRRAHG